MRDRYFLQPGDVVEIIAPASGCAVEHLQLGVAWLKKQGFVPVFDPEILKPEMFLAQTDQYRFKMLKKALFNKKTKAIWCLRGGYGSFRLWPELLKINKKPTQEKLFIGLSDITSLHQFLNQKWGWKTLHGSLLDRLGQGLLPLENESEILSVITGKVCDIVFENLQPLNQSARKNKVIKGTLRGGNLVTFTASLATPLQPKYKKNENVILFFEEIGERGYRVDRLLWQNLMARTFTNVQAIVFGDFIKGEEATGKDFVPDVLKNFAEKLKIPVYAGIEAGHNTTQRPIFFNSLVKLTCGAKAKMVVYSDET